MGLGTTGNETVTIRLIVPAEIDRQSGLLARSLKKFLIGLLGTVPSPLIIKDLCDEVLAMESKNDNEHDGVWQ